MKTGLQLLLTHGDLYHQKGMKTRTLLKSIKKNRHIREALTLDDLLLPYGFTQENVDLLRKLEHVTVDYARKFVKSGMQPAQAVAFMEKKWKAPNFDLYEIEPETR